MAELLQSVERALEILLYLEQQGRERGVTQIASDLGIHKSTVYRTLVTMEAKGFVQKDPVTERYWLGRRLFALGKRVERQLGIRQVAQPYLRRLCAAYQETAVLTVLVRDAEDGCLGLVVLKEEGGNPVPGADIAVGQESPCAETAAGRCLLAFCRGAAWGRYGQGGKGKRDGGGRLTARDLRAQLRQIREQGCAIGQDELGNGVAEIAVPILKGRGEAVAAISQAGEVTRLLSGDPAERIEAMKRAAREIAAQL